MTAAAAQSNDGIEILGNVTEEYGLILTDEALAFVAGLQRKYGSVITQRLKERETRAESIRNGEKLDFLPETKAIREGDWKVGSIPQDLQNRRVEITGPVERKMIVNALNSGALAYMADFEDSLTPTWDNVVQGQINLRDAINNQIDFTNEAGKEYKLKATIESGELATLIVRPRGWHLLERHIEVDGEPVYGGLVDFGLYFFHNHKTLLEKNSGPYFYLPKLETHQEAAIWNDIFVDAQEQFGLPVGTIKATVLIETITAAFEMDEILHALKDHIVAQNAGRWDYIFSYIKKHAHDANFICPDRAQVTMVQPFMRAYCLHLIKTCHKRGAFAMGGMAAFIPVKNDEDANAKAMEMVGKDKAREASDGHDGTWVAHPGLIATAKAAFDSVMTTPNQVDRQRDDVNVSADDLLQQPDGEITEGGLRNNISVGLQYLESWLRGNGCVPIFNLMEDAATAEIARTQIWQWIHHGCRFGDVKDALNEHDGEKITADLFRQYRAEELAKIKEAIGEDAFNAGKFDEASKILEELVLADQMEEFLTLPASEQLG